MPTPGREVLRRLRHHLDEVRAEAARQRQSYAAIDERLRDIAGDRTQAVLELAAHALPEVSPTTIAATFSGIQADLQGILRRQEQTQAELEGRLQRCLRVVEATQAEVATLTEQLNIIVAQREQLEQQLAEQLEQDTEFQRLSGEAVQAELQLQANELRAQEVQLEASRKLPAYDRSRLFKYLLRRGYGTADYPRKGLTRQIDGWLARYIDFVRARQGYEFLQSTPARINEEVGLRREAFEALMAEVEAAHARHAEVIGLPSVLEQGAGLGDQRDRLLSRLSDEQEQVHQVEQDLERLGSQQGRFYREALERLTLFIEQTESAVLESQARATPDPIDDDLVAKVRWLSERIEQTRPEVDAMLRKSQAAESLSEGMGFVVRRAEQANLDSDRCSTDSDDAIERDIRLFREGGMRQDDLWQAIERQLQFEPTWIESSTRSSGDLMSHPTTQVLLQVLAHAAVSAVTNASRDTIRRSAERSVARRQQSRLSSSTIDRAIPDGGRGPRQQRGFSTGRGF
ncbi:MAG: hypothetical protein R3B90_19995 [Planctomycetaceae bacterium]